jgi:hypothetical protein
VLASEWHCPADAVAMRTAKTLAESYGMTSAAALTRVVGHVVLAVIATAEADRTKDAAIAFVDLIHAATGKRALMACSGREPIDAVEDYVIERVTTINVSFVICTVRAAAARNRLVGFTEPFMPAPNSTEYAVIMAPYVEAIKASGRTDAMVQPSTDAFREWLKPRLDDGSYFGWIAQLDGPRWRPWA